MQLRCEPANSAKKLVREGVDEAQVILGWMPGGDAPFLVEASTTQGGVSLQVPRQELPPDEWFHDHFDPSRLRIAQRDWAAAETKSHAEIRPGRPRRAPLVCARNLNLASDIGSSTITCDRRPSASERFARKRARKRIASPRAIFGRPGRKPCSASTVSRVAATRRSRGRRTAHARTRYAPQTPRRCHHFGNLFRHLL